MSEKQYKVSWTPRTMGKAVVVADWCMAAKAVKMFLDAGAEMVEIEPLRVEETEPDAAMEFHPIPVDTARVRRVCRICQQNIDPSPGNPMILNYGNEYAHEQCLKRYNPSRD